MHTEILHYSDIPEQPWPQLEACLLSKISPAKAESVSRLRLAADRNGSLLGLLLLWSAMKALSRPMAWEALEFPFMQKPRLSTREDFSISHGGGRVACAVVLHGSVGLDVEPEGRLLEPALRLIATQEELARVAAGGGSATRLAVAKEAVLKAAGGRYTQLKQVSLGTEMGCFAEVGYWLQYPDLGAGYVAALALSESCPALQPVYWEPTQLLKRFLASG